MDFKCRINTIVKRAKLIGQPLRDVCAAAEVNISTFYRWQQDDANPRLRSMIRALDAMEAHLDQREQALVQQLTRGAA
jgi:DNA-binding phage protein